MSDPATKKRKGSDQVSAKDQAIRARDASRTLQALSNGERQGILNAIADSLLEKEATILAENQLDIDAAAGMEDTLRARLVLSHKKLQTLADGLRAIGAAPSPIGREMRKTELADGLILTQSTVPIGVLLIIFESRPDCLPQIAGLSLCSGNGLVLKGGKEAARTNRLLHSLIGDAIEKASGGRVSREVIALVESRSDVADLLKLDEVIDLVIPRGSGALVHYIQQNTKIPVMGHSEGICHVYVDTEADVEKAMRICVDSKTDYPAACNAVETILLHQSLFSAAEGPGKSKGERVCQALIDAGVQLHACEKTIAALPSTKLTAVESFKTEYGSLACSVKIVTSMDEAVAHIHRFGSGHTESIVTENASTAVAFQHMADAACVFHNVSTRFADGFRFGLGAEVGISTGRIHARGPVGVEGLTTTKWKLSSASSDIASEYNNGTKSFTHKTLPVSQ